MIMGGGGGGGEVAGYILLLTGWHKSSRLVRLSFYMVPYLKSAPIIHLLTRSLVCLLSSLSLSLLYIYTRSPEKESNYRRFISLQEKEKNELIDLKQQHNFH